MDTAERPVRDERPELAERGDELHERRGQQVQPARRAPAATSASASARRLRERLLDDDVAAGRSAARDVLGVGGGRRQHDDDVGRREHRLDVADDRQAGPARGQLGAPLGPSRADRSERPPDPRYQPIEHLQVGRQDVAGADDPDADGGRQADSQFTM